MLCHICHIDIRTEDTTGAAGIAIGEIIRYIKRCSTHAAFVRMVNLLSSRLAARGWPRWFITKAYARAPLYSA
eukprot:COSAG06_NODE_14155_length_1183_cov_30.038745_2_plen_72_part_01